MKQLTLLDLVLQERDEPLTSGRQENIQFKPTSQFSYFSGRDTSRVLQSPNNSKGNQKMSPMAQHIEHMIDTLGISVNHLEYSQMPQQELIYSVDAYQPGLSTVDYVPMSLFRDVISQIEERMISMDARLENKERLQHLNDQLVTMQESDHVLEEDQSKPATKQSRNPSQANQALMSAIDDMSSSLASPLLAGSEQDFSISRMNLQEKKLRQLEEKMTKLIKEEDKLRKEVQRDINITLKKVEDSLQKFSKQGKDMLLRIEEINDHQKQIVQHLNKLKDDLAFHVARSSLFQQETMEKQQSFEGALTILGQLANSTSEEFTEFKISVHSIERDLLLILKNYKDTLKEFEIIHNVQHEMITIKQDMQMIMDQW